MKLLSLIKKGVESFFQPKKKKEHYQWGPGERVMWLKEKKELKDKYPANWKIKFGDELSDAEAKYYGRISPRHHNLMHLRDVDVTNFFHKPVSDVRITGTANTGGRSDGPLFQVRIIYSDGTFAEYSGFDAATVTQLFRTAGKDPPSSIALL